MLKRNEEKFSSVKAGNKAREGERTGHRNLRSSEVKGSVRGSRAETKREKGGEPVSGTPSKAKKREVFHHQGRKRGEREGENRSSEHQIKRRKREFPAVKARGKAREGGATR